MNLVLNKRKVATFNEEEEEVLPQTTAQTVTGSVPSGFGDRVESVQSDDPDLSYFEDLAKEL